MAAIRVQSRAGILLKTFLRFCARTGRRFALAGLERAEFHQADGGGEFRLVQRGLQAADGVGLADGDRQLEDLLGQLRDVRRCARRRRRGTRRRADNPAGRPGPGPGRSSWKISSSRSAMMRRRCSRLTVLAAAGRVRWSMVIVWPLTASSTSAEPCSILSCSARPSGTFRP